MSFGGKSWSSYSPTTGKLSPRSLAQDQLAVQAPCLNTPEHSSTLSTMRILRPIAFTLPRVLRRCYSTPNAAPLINVLDVPAPHNGRIRILSLARPSARNAISRQLLYELRTNIDSIHSEYDSEGDEVPPQKLYGGVAGENQRGPTRAVILASEVDSCFCAGADLKERVGFTAEEYVFPVY